MYLDCGVFVCCFIVKKRAGVMLKLSSAVRRWISMWLYSELEAWQSMGCIPFFVFILFLLRVRHFARV